VRFKYLEQLPIRSRLAGVSGLLTFAILLIFALTVGKFTNHYITQNFNDAVSQAADDLQDRIIVRISSTTGQAYYDGPKLELYTTTDRSAIRLVTLDGEVLKETRNAPDFGAPFKRTIEKNGYRIETRSVSVLPPRGKIYVQYGRPYHEIKESTHNIWLLLLFGTTLGALMAAFAGYMVARRAMRPVTDLTEKAKEIADTRNPNIHLPRSSARDEISKLARTLDDMLSQLAAAYSEIELLLTHQRRFTADISHELRTPLTSILANLELLSEQLPESQRQAVASGLRSATRMQTLVNDLLILARSDTKQNPANLKNVDLTAIVREVVAELKPIAQDHILIDEQLDKVELLGEQEKLYRVVINLIENAIKHTPPKTKVTVSLKREKEFCVLKVADNGPGISAELQGKLFERFVSGHSDRGVSSGLGLAIVRAVAEQHGGSAEVESTTDVSSSGTTFIVKLPLQRSSD